MKDNKPPPRGGRVVKKAKVKQKERKETKCLKREKVRNPFSSGFDFEILCKSLINFKEYAKNKIL